MVATVLKIRLRILANTLTASILQLIGFILGGIGMLWLLGLAVTGLVVAGFAGLEVSRTAIVLGGAVLTVLWIVAPLFLGGVDTTIDAPHLAQFPMSTSRMMLALAATVLIGVPGAATLIGSLATFATWAHFPIALVAAVVCVPLGVAICVVASRALAGALGGGRGGRRTRELLGVAALLILMLIGPLLFGLIELIDILFTTTDDPAGRLATIVGVVAWTPLGAAWAVPGDLAAGDVLPALGRLGVAVATLALFVLLWHRSLRASLVPSAGARAARRGGGRLSWFGRMPVGGTGATWARALTYWLRDTRYLQQLLILPLFPVLFLFWAGGDTTSWMFAFSPAFAAFLLGASGYADISYDGTAFATALATGIRGRDDRAGRMLAAASVGVPLIAAIALITTGVGGTWELLPGVLGTSLGALFAGYAVCAVSSAALVVPVAASGESPFKRVPGQTFTTTLVFFVLWAIAGVLTLPAFGFAIAAVVTGGALWSWLSLVAGVGLGALYLVIGVRVGGRMLERRGPELLQKLRAFKGI